MAEIAWTEEAQRWLAGIFEHIAADDPAAAGRTVQEIYERSQVLLQHTITVRAPCGAGFL